MPLVVELDRGLSFGRKFTSCGACSFVRPGVLVVNFIDARDSFCKAGAIRDLNIEAGARIHFQNKWPALAVDHHIDAKVAKAGDLIAARR